MEEGKDGSIKEGFPEKEMNIDANNNMKDNINDNTHENEKNNASDENQFNNNNNDDDDDMNELLDNFLQDIENITSNKEKKVEDKKLNKEDAGKEINRILEHKNSSPFEIFGIYENINMDLIKSRYRKLSILIHPDKCKIDKAADAFHILTRAYEELQKDDIKEQYKSVYEIAKKNIIKKHQLKKKKINEINEYLNKSEEEYEITKEIQQLINEECENLLKVQREKMEYAQKCKLANMKYVQEKEEERLKEEMEKEKEKKLWEQGRDERVNNWKNYKKENLKDEKEFHLYKNINKKKQERTEEQKQKLKNVPLTYDQNDVNKKRKIN
ncbi:DnaJ protein, putative [Plasmodium gaboni]|uniref:DnaJ protein, putative n=1 Tax=Plasmodium gaboni TaxID=647221 RepID=A0ABY1UR60_9APIC|nr:DnaJ protein, putative [Plasmodium gaboni]